MRFAPVLLLALISISPFVNAQEGDAPAAAPAEAPAAAPAAPVAEAPKEEAPKAEAVTAPAIPPAQPAQPVSDVKPNAPADTGGDYEIDYEEEPEGATETADESGEEPEAKPAKPAKKAQPKKSVAAKPAPVIDRNAPTSQGTRSKNKFAPMLKADTKSIYKKNGKFLDVDTD